MKLKSYSCHLFLFIGFLALVHLQCSDNLPDEPLVNKYLQLESIPLMSEKSVLSEKLDTDVTFSNLDLSLSRGIDSHNCYYDHQERLIITMNFGFGNGHLFQIIYQDNIVETKMKSYGCTPHEKFNFKTVKQSLILNTKDFNKVDSLIGYIEYEGVQDIATKKMRLIECDVDTDWLKGIEPQTVRIKGSFRMKLSDRFIRRSCE